MKKLIVLFLSIAVMAIISSATNSKGTKTEANPMTSPSPMVGEKKCWQIYCFDCYYEWTTPCQESPENCCYFCFSPNVYDESSVDCVETVYWNCKCKICGWCGNTYIKESCGGGRGDPCQGWNCPFHGCCPLYENCWEAWTCNQ